MEERAEPDGEGTSYTRPGSASVRRGHCTCLHSPMLRTYYGVPSLAVGAAGPRNGRHRHHPHRHLQAGLRRQYWSPSLPSQHEGSTAGHARTNCGGLTSSSANRGHSELTQFAHGWPSSSARPARCDIRTTVTCDRPILHKHNQYITPPITH